MKIEHTTQGIGNEFYFLCTLKEDDGVIIESGKGESESHALDNLRKKIHISQIDSIKKSNRLIKFVEDYK